MENFDITRIRTSLLLDQPFFGTLAMHLQFVADSSIETAQTNGVYLKYNPVYLASLSEREAIGVLAHEVLHCALLHPYRRSGRDLHEWNVACDFATNEQLLASGFALPEGVLVDAQYSGMSAEQIYSKRQNEQQQPSADEEEQQQSDEADEQQQSEDEQHSDESDSSDDDDREDEEQPSDVNEDDDLANEADSDDANETGDADGSDDAQNASEGEGEGEAGESDGAGAAESSMPGVPTGEFVDGPETAEQSDELTAADWEVIAAEAAAVADKAGELPGFLARALKQTREAKIDWRAALQAFLTNVVESDYSWSTPNRRLISRGIYMPGAFKENIGPIVVGVDVSGSVSQQMLDEFASELNGLLRDARPEKLHVVYCDTRICGVSQIEIDDDAELKLPAESGGGTLFQPVFDYIEAEQLDPLACVYLTDLEGPAPVEPSYPVLWVTPEYSREFVPFGELVRMP